MKSLFDIDVILDAFNLKSSDKESKGAIQQIILGNADGFLLANQVLRLYGELRRYKKSSEVKNIMTMINRTFKILPLDGQIIEAALSHNDENLKELTMLEAKNRYELDNIVSINPARFNNDEKVITPSQFILVTDEEE